MPPTTRLGEQLALLPPASEHCLRWNAGQHHWRHRHDGGFRRERYQVAPIDERTARAFVLTHHYSRSYPAARLRYGLFDHDAPEALVGVAVLGVPMTAAVLTNVLPDLDPYRQSLTLDRFVLLDAVPGNAETFFLARAFDQAARTGLRGVVSFADPMPRPRHDGTLVMPGHIGTIYQAKGAVFTGRGTPRTVLLTGDGRLLPERALQKLRAGESGRDYVTRLLVDAGARPPRPGTPARRWLLDALNDAGVTRVRHRGCFRYVFALGQTRAQRAAVRIEHHHPRYPKQRDPAPAGTAPCT